MRTWAPPPSGGGGGRGGSAVEGYGLYSRRVWGVQNSVQFSSARGDAPDNYILVYYLTLNAFPGDNQTVVFNNFPQLFYGN